MTVRTKRGAVRRYNAILNRCFRDMRGGLQFGMDWVTLRITWPDRYADLAALRDAYPTLPD